MIKGYKLATSQEFEAKRDAINNSGFFPADNGKTTDWIKDPIILKSGEFFIPEIPVERMDLAGVPQEMRDALGELSEIDITDILTNDEDL